MGAWGLEGPGFCAAEEGCSGEAGDAGPIGHVEAGAGVGLRGVGGGVMKFERLDDLTAGGFLFGARGARPVDEKTLSTNSAADITYGIGDFT